MFPLEEWLTREHLQYIALFLTVITGALTIFQKVMGALKQFYDWCSLKLSYGSPDTLRSRMQDMSLLSIKDDFKLPWLENHPLEHALLNGICDGKHRTGVGILLTPRGVGKSTRSKIVAKCCFEEGTIGGVLYCDFSECKKNESVQSFFYQYVQDHYGGLTGTSNLATMFANFTETPLLLLDQVESVRECPEFKSFFINVAHAAANTNCAKGYFALALCSDTETA